MLTVAGYFYLQSHISISSLAKFAFSPDKLQDHGNGDNYF